jgi:hypothetical protein
MDAGQIEVSPDAVASLPAVPVQGDCSEQHMSLQFPGTQASAFVSWAVNLGDKVV